MTANSQTGSSIVDVIGIRAGLSNAFAGAPSHGAAEPGPEKTGRRAAGGKPRCKRDLVPCGRALSSEAPGARRATG